MEMLLFEVNDKRFQEECIGSDGSTATISKEFPANRAERSLLNEYGMYFNYATTDVKMKSLNHV